MKPFLAEKRKLIDLGILFILEAILYFVWESWPMVCLFSFGFIWNWTASQELTILLSNPRYRFSTVRFVGNVQSMVLKPVQRFPQFVQTIFKVFPAGIFWGMVILINDSDMPWWMTFAGSLVFEILQIEIRFLQRAKKESL